MDLLSAAAIENELEQTPGWERTGEAITKKVELTDFKEAMNFVNEVAQIAEAADHHPDIAIKWNKVTLTLSTHSAGGLTGRDFALARQLNQL